MDISDLIDKDELLLAILAASLLAPGFLIGYFRTIFITGRLAKISDRLLEFVIVSCIYFSLAGPVLFYFGRFSPAAIFVFFFLAPAIAGLLLGIMHQRDVFISVARGFGLSIVDPRQTAWDYLFSELSGQGAWVVVTLKSHKQIFGWYGGGSSTSHDLGHRDIFVHSLCDANWNSVASSGPHRGIWIHEDELQTIEVIPLKNFGER